MKSIFALVGPLGVLLAWSAPWTCGSFAHPTGGATAGGTGGGGQYTANTPVPVVAPLPGSGVIGVVAAAGGGVTIGPSAAFNSDFVYMSNSADGTVSRILIPAGGLTPPYEEARYTAVMPWDNHDREPCIGGACSGHNDIWQHGGADQYSCGGCNSPSRTLIDRNGNVWVALRAPGLQAGATKIIDVDDHLAECHPRCHQRAGLVAGQAFTEGVPLNLSGGGTVTLSPPGLIAPGSAYATTYACTDAAGVDPVGTAADTSGTSETDPRNYDDCIAFSIPLGHPHPDPNADPTQKTVGYSFGRAAAISPNCDPATGDCDVWVGMWNGAAWVRLSYNGTGAPGSLPFDVGPTVTPAMGPAVDTGVFPIGVSPYGGSVDCAGIIWGVGQNLSVSGAPVELSAVSTVAVHDTIHAVNVPAYQVLSNFAFSDHSPVVGVPREDGQAYYGISSDTKERIWLAAGSTGPKASSFDATSLLGLLSIYQMGSQPTYATWLGAIQTAIHLYDFGSVSAPPSNVTFSSSRTYARGINVDKNNNVFVGMDTSPWNGNSPGTGVVSFNPDTVGSVACQEGSGVACPDATLNWAYNDRTLAAGAVPPRPSGGSVGVDIDAEGDVWAGNFGSGAGQGAAVRLDGATGALLNYIPVGRGIYSYSDFTGYALRNITLSRSVYPSAIAGCAISPEFTDWSTLSFTGTVPPGTDLSFDVRVTNATDPASIAAAQDFTVCDSVSNPSTATSCPLLSGTLPTSGTIDLSKFNLPQGTYLNVYVTMTPLICSANGGSNPLAKPVLLTLNTTEVCPGD